MAAGDEDVVSGGGGAVAHGAACSSCKAKPQPSRICLLFCQPWTAMNGTWAVQMSRRDLGLTGSLSRLETFYTGQPSAGPIWMP